ncbi:HD domain-containing protein [soil metagenome]
MKVPSTEEAETLLLQAETRNPGPWVAPSRNVALAARCLAEPHPGLNSETAYVMGLLHDLGRQEGVTGMRHTLDGYTFLQNLGYNDAARICLTHSFPRQDARAIFGHWDVSEEEFKFIDGYLSSLTYTDYDRLLQLCDCLALSSGLCLLEKRMIDVALRQGVNEYTVAKWQAYLDIQKAFETELGCSIYELLPGVVATTFGSGF